ncbi:MAG: hypothetical protein LBT89_06070 [Planctomycetaceae bacterium]|jgi:hypothetical protein|nr:hypothetical protein [Planctomycetaceae bacterium]
MTAPLCAAVAKANVNLHCVLRNIEELCRCDAQAAEAVRGQDTALQFAVKGCDPATLSFRNGLCRYSRLPNERYSLRLSFSSPERFNRLMNGEKITPSFNLFGLFYVRFLFRNFAVLTERLEYYLKPKDETLLQDSQFFPVSTALTAFVVFQAIAEVGNDDPAGRAIVSRMPAGTVCAEIIGGPAISLRCEQGRLTAFSGKTESPNAVLVFKDMQTAGDVLRGKLDTHAAMAQGLFSIRGKIPMLETVNQLLYQVKRYLR